MLCCWLFDVVFLEFFLCDFSCLFCLKTKQLFNQKYNYSLNTSTKKQQKNTNNTNTIKHDTKHTSKQTQKKLKLDTYIYIKQKINKKTLTIQTLSNTQQQTNHTNTYKNKIT